MTLFAALRIKGPSADGPVLVSEVPPPVDDALLRGDGVFETVLVCGGRAFDLPEHVARLQLSAAQLQFAAPPATDWLPVTSALIGAFGGPDFALRLVATRSGSCFASASAIPDSAVAQRAGIAVILAPDPFNRLAPYATTSAKTLSYATNLAALRYARGCGADDVIFTAPDGTITETPTATVILAIDDGFVTPSAYGLLPPVTAARLHPRTKPVTAQELHAADAVYLVSAIRLAAPVTSLDGSPRPQRPDITDRIMHALVR